MRDYQTKANVGGAPDSITNIKLGAGETNSALKELESAVSRSGQTLAPDDGTGEDLTQLAKSLFIHGVKSTSFQDNGSANVIQLTPISGASGVLLPSSYANLSGARFVFTAAATNTGATTLNIGQTTGALLGAKAIVASDGSALSSGAIEIGKQYEAQYSLTANNFRLLPWSESQTQINNTVADGYYRGLNITQNTATPSTKTDVLCDFAVLSDGAGGYDTVSSVSGTIDFTITGVNALDSGALVATTWYAIFIISDGAGTSAVLGSTSATSPTLPGGYTHYKRVGWRYYDTVDFRPSLQRDDTANYTVDGVLVTNIPIMVSGAQGDVNTPTFVAVSVSSFVPPTAKTLFMSVLGKGDTTPTLVASSANFGNRSAINLPPTSFSTSNPTNNTNFSSIQEIVLETTNIYYAAANAAAKVRTLGWKDSI